MPQRRRPQDTDFAKLLAVRTALRRFERWSADQATAQGITASQHQLLLAVRGHGDPAGPTISETAEYLLVRHHSAVELADRCESHDLVVRTPDPDDRRVVRLTLSSRGARVLDALAPSHLEELARLTPLFESLLGTLHASAPAAPAASRPTTVDPGHGGGRR